MNAVDSATLHARYGIPQQVAFKDGPGGLVMIEVDNKYATATIALQGAQLLSWTPKGAQPVIWFSRAAKFAAGKSIRGGAPVCWPWFGPHSTEPSFPAHGFARSAPWEIVDTQSLEDGSSRLVFRLCQTEANRPLWPHASVLQCHITIGATLGIELVTCNIGIEALTISQALHTYFAVSDVRQIAIHGLDGCRYLDKVDGGKRKSQSGAVTFTEETDRIYLDSTADCVIDDPGLKRRIVIRKRGSRSTVVWNPWVEKAEKLGDMGENGYLNMVCVESANVAEDVVVIPPGNEHCLEVHYSIECLE